ncbi:MAG TPA: tyrosine-type recombinase/integrase [Capsulimonadaceae bacterium]
MNAYVWDTGDDQFELGETLVWSGDKNLGIAELYEAYLYSKNRTYKHVRMVKGVVERTGTYAMSLTPPIPPQRFGVKAAQGFLRTMEERGLSDNTRRDTAIKLKSLFKWLKDEGYFPRDNMERLRNPSVLIEPRPHYAITPEEIVRMREANRWLWSDERDPKSRFKRQFVRDLHRLQFDAQFLLMVDGGLRPKESCNALLSDLDIENCTITLAASRTKSGRTRVVPLSERYVKGPLKDWLDFRANLSTMLGDRDPGTIFVTERGDVRNPDHWLRRFERIRKEAGIERRITPYTCRRHASTVHDMVDESASKRIVGHTSDSVHDRYHVPNARQVAQLRAIHETADPLAGVL